MGKKRVIILAVLMISIIVVFNIYLIISNNNVNSQIEQSTSLTQSLTDISNLRIEINRMSQAQKLHIITSKDKYEMQYETYLDNIYDGVNQLYKDKLIDSDDKTKLFQALDSYKDLSRSIDTNLVDNNNSQELENILIKVNDAQILILSNLDNAINTAKESVSEQNALIKTTTDFQVNGVQTVSTVITSMISVFIYVVKKYSSPDSKKEIDSFVKIHKHY